MCVVLGTRPEAIKLAPLLHVCRRRRDIQPLVCSTGQHREMLQQVLDYFELQVDHDLQVMQPNQTLSALTARCLTGLDEWLRVTRPDCVVAQGDTTTVLAAALAAFYQKIPFVHVEAGLRTGNVWSPWPEELNRRAASLMTALHCAPTLRARQHLLQEGVAGHRIHVTGNTVIDALLWAVERERARAAHWRQQFVWLEDRRLVLITGHRRENFGDGFEQICLAIRELAHTFPEVCFVYPVHLNPNVQEPVHRLLGSVPNVYLLPPVAYPAFVWLMDRATLVLTDSGGVQEEAPSLKKPVVVMRETTERPEAVEAGAAELVGTSSGAIVNAVSRLLTDPVEYARRQLGRNPYGDGHAAERIADLIVAQAWSEPLTIRRAA
ncbi:MAG: UDP-N-acetyl glucosamine 2-epimerase [Planctomycetaceae bacterium]|nr:MAG: UDP-N-acetyl glucosamine 2-epimerase [Planctomycetaceae bacterium]